MFNINICLYEYKYSKKVKCIIVLSEAIGKDKNIIKSIVDYVQEQNMSPVPNSIDFIQGEDNKRSYINCSVIENWGSPCKYVLEGTKGVIDGLLANFNEALKKFSNIYYIDFSHKKKWF